MISPDILQRLSIYDISTNIDHKKNIIDFEYMVGLINRPGIKTLLDWIKSTDFYKAPSSTMFHNNYPGGLLDHSIKVAKLALFFADVYNKTRKLDNTPIYTAENVIIAALFHDLCKTNFYHIIEKKTKLNGSWIDYSGYEVVDNFPFGHGEKSVLILMGHMHLTGCELLAIRWHMGLMDNGSYTDKAQNEAFNRSPLVTLVHTADMQSSFLYERIYDLKCHNILTEPVLYE